MKGNLLLEAIMVFASIRGEAIATGSPHDSNQEEGETVRSTDRTGDNLLPEPGAGRSDPSPANLYPMILDRVDLTFQIEGWADEVNLRVRERGRFLLLETLKPDEWRAIRSEETTLDAIGIARLAAKGYTVR